MDDTNGIGGGSANIRPSDGDIKPYDGDILPFDGDVSREYDI